MSKQSGQSRFSKSNILLKKLPSKKKSMSDKKKLLSYLSYEYGITYFNKTFVYKLDHVHDGTLQNLQVPITYDVLLEMFKYYKHELSRQKIYNKKISKVFNDSQSALNYDLAIILSKHSDYLKVLEKEKIQTVESAQLSQTVKYIEQVTTSHISHKNNEKEINIENMLEDW